MGSVCDFLIPAAVLYNNPGITKEEFSELINQTRSPDRHPTDNWRDECAAEPWDTVDSNIAMTGLRESSRYHRGLHGLARNLGLNHRLKPTNVDGIEVLFPVLNVIPRLVKGNWLSLIYEVTQFEVFDVAKDLEKITRQFCYRTPEAGSIFWDSSDSFKVEEILSENSRKHSFENEDGSIEECTATTYTFLKRTFSQKEHRYMFISRDELKQYFPELDPENMFDFSQEEGFFEEDASWDGVPIMYHLEKDLGLFKWRMKDGKYYLDKETFNLIPGSYDGRSSGYTFLVQTAEAIKQKAWKMFGYNDDRCRKLFLKDFPESRKEYAQAIWAAHTSQFAKRQEMTYSELLRFRITGRL